MKVFVYGTLQRSQSNNHLLAGCEFLGADQVEGFKLFNAGFPVATPNENTKITGEVFEVRNGEVLEHLDWLEGYDGPEYKDNMYDRKDVRTVSGHYCQMYVGGHKFWKDFNGMSECPNEDGVYTWKKR